MKMKKVLLVLAICMIGLTVLSQSKYGHLCIEVKKEGMTCPIRNGIVFKDSFWIHIPLMEITFEDIVNDSITVRTNYQIFQDSTMFVNHKDEPQTSTILTELIAKYDKDDFTFTNLWIAYLREEIKRIFNVDNGDIRIVKL